jgi:hypothetical protein
MSDEGGGTYYREEPALLRAVLGLAYLDLGRYGEAARIHEKRVEDGFRGRPTVARG